VYQKKEVPDMTMRLQGASVLLVGGSSLMVIAGCARQATTTRPATQPTDQTAVAPQEPHSQVSEPRVIEPPAKPIVPASRPATKPSEPRFEVTSLGPNGKEAHWIVVEKWADGLDKGTVFGKWLRPNVMEIEVKGAEQVRLMLGRLPIRSGSRIILRIEDASMELGRNLLPTVRLRRSSTGAWSAMKD
jgi:hypothetical protein